MKYPLRLNSLSPLANRVRDVCNLNDRIWLNDAQEVLFKQRIIQRRQVRAYCRIRGKFYSGQFSSRPSMCYANGGRGRTIFILPQRLLELGEIPLLMCTCDGAHTLYLAELCVFERELVA
jgi:hypothetical protein